MKGNIDTFIMRHVLSKVAKRIFNILENFIISKLIAFNSPFRVRNS